MALIWSLESNWNEKEFIPKLVTLLAFELAIQVSKLLLPQNGMKMPTLSVKFMQTFRPFVTC